MKDEDMYEGYAAQPFEREEWWLASPEPLLVWARLRILESGVAQVLDSHGETLTYESEDMARSALMDADFRGIDGMDEDDANAIGMMLEELSPPHGEDEEALLPQMIRNLGPRH